MDQSDLNKFLMTSLGNKLLCQPTIFGLEYETYTSATKFLNKPMTCKNIGHVISKLRIEKLYQSFHCSQYTHSIINDSCTTKAALN